MDFELRRNPDTGDIEEKVVNWQHREQAELEAEVNNVQSAFDASNVELEATRSRVAELESQVRTQEGALTTAKSKFDAYTGLVSESGVAPDDTGATSESDGVETPAEEVNPADNF